MNQTLRWILVFSGLFLLSQDYLFFKWAPSTALLGLPGWLGWFIAVHLLLVLEFLRFQKKYWK